MKNKTTNPNKLFKIFPYSFIRYASGHHNEFDQLCWAEMKELYENFNANSHKLDIIKNTICEYLYDAVKEAIIITDKQFLLDIKRDVFNSRTINEQQWEKFLASLPAEKKIIFHQYTQLKAIQVVLSQEWEQVYLKKIKYHRTILQIMSMNDLLQKGIRLSSKVLSDQLKSFTTTPVTAFKNKAFRQEYSLLRYITRMYFKTSPFSTFTFLGLCDVGTTELTYEPILTSDCVKSKVRLNNEIYSYLKTLLALNPLINEQLYIQFNPTIQASDRHTTFLINFHNLESFQTLKKSSIIETLFDINASGKAYKLYEWIENLENLVESDRATIKTYLLKLVDIGLLEFNFSTSGIDPNWDLALINYLKKIHNPTPLLTETIDVLSNQRSNCEAYAKADVTERGQLLERMHIELNTLFGRFHESFGFTKQEQEIYKAQYKSSFSMENFEKKPYLLPNFTAEKLIYEDSSISERAKIDNAVLTKILNKVNELCTVLLPTDAITEERYRLKAFFLEHYREDEKVNLLDYYRNYYQLIKNPQKDLQQNSDENASDVHTKDYQKVYDEWVDHFRQLIKPVIKEHCTEIALTGKMFDSMNERFPSDQKGCVYSRGVFAQVFISNGKPQAVLNNVFQGFGRASGRFLHLFDPMVTEDLKSFNKNIAPDHILMELTDGSYFNANSHPPLLAYELKIPDGHNTLPLESQIAVKDIQVCFDIEANELCLKHKVSGHKILPFDLCLQSLTQRSKLFQLLANFSPDQAVNFSPIQKAIHEVLFDGIDLAGKREVYHFPRIVYEDNIIIKRRSWSVSTLFVPKKGDQESEASYFMRINQWREKNNFPNQIFFYLHSRSSAKEQKGADDYKPQYIRFDTPLLILLWTKLLKKAGEYIYFEEMMPDTEMLGKQPVNELLVQWYYQ